MFGAAGLFMDFQSMARAIIYAQAATQALVVVDLPGFVRAVHGYRLVGTLFGAKRAVHTLGQIHRHIAHLHLDGLGLMVDIQFFLMAGYRIAGYNF